MHSKAMPLLLFGPEDARWISDVPLLLCEAVAAAAREPGVACGPFGEGAFGRETAATLAGAAAGSPGRLNGSAVR
jgi:hypothetical protein